MSQLVFNKSYSSQTPHQKVPIGNLRPVDVNMTQQCLNAFLSGDFKENKILQGN
jgi:hypothetical protein